MKTQIKRLTNNSYKSCPECGHGTFRRFLKFGECLNCKHSESYQFRKSEHLESVLDNEQITDFKRNLGLAC